MVVLDRLEQELYTAALQLAVVRRNTELLRARLGQNLSNEEPSTVHSATIGALQAQLRQQKKELEQVKLEESKATDELNRLVAEELEARESNEMLKERIAVLRAAGQAPFSCELCGGDEHPVDDAFPLQCCGRRVCREMMTGYAVAEIGEARVPVRCPFKNQQCRGEVGEMELVTLLDDGAYGQYRRIQLRQIQEMQGMAFCRAADCNGMIFRDDLGQPGTASTAKHHFVCTVNGEHQWCLQCDVIWHKGSTCAQYQEWKQNNANGDAEVERLVREMGWRRCPGCQNGVERVAGCNAMKCRCGAGFCYLCGFNAPGGDAHGHFNEPGPCHGKVWANP